MARTTKFQDLNLNNAFLFAAAMEDEETCKLFIETILGEQLGSITVKSERMSTIFLSEADTTRRRWISFRG